MRWLLCSGISFWGKRSLPYAGRVSPSYAPAYSSWVGHTRVPRRKPVVKGILFSFCDRGCRHRRRALRFARHEEGRRGSRFPARRAAAFCAARDAGGMDVDGNRDDDTGLLLTSSHAVDRECEFGRSGDRFELYGGRGGRLVVPARAHQRAALAGGPAGLYRRHDGVAEQALGLGGAAPRLGFLRIHLHWLSNLDGYPKPLVIRVTNCHANAHITGAEAKSIV